jgi:4,5-dihydroxyphthalate decarboxylase
MLELTIATGLNDRTAALHDGRVRPEGLSVTWLALNAEQIFWRMLRHAEFDASEMSLAGYSIRRAEGNDDFLAIPVFPSRVFRHSSVYVHADAGISTPEDLRGKTVGVGDYRMTAAVWARGFLSDDHGVESSAIEWVQGGLEESGRQPIEPGKPRGVVVRQAPEGATLAGMLARGEIHALITPRAPSTLNHPSVRPLFDDPGAIERDYFRRSAIFPIMHTVAVRRDVADRHPWVPQTLATAFLRSKQAGEATLRSVTGSLPIALPFLAGHIEETVRLMGDDYWPYGLEANRTALETFFRYLREQGIVEREPSLEGFFAQSTVAVSRI